MSRWYSALSRCSSVALHLSTAAFSFPTFLIALSNVCLLSVTLNACRNRELS